MNDHAPRINALRERRSQIFAVLIALAIAFVILASTAQSSAEPVASQQVVAVGKVQRSEDNLEALLIHCLQGGRIDLGDGTAVSCKVRRVRK